MAILRSPYAHANIRSIDTSRGARRCRACVAVFVGADIPYNPLPMAWPAGGSGGHPEQRQHARGSLATDSVKWTGEGVAAVVAETRGAGARRARRDRRRLGAAARRSSTPRRRSQPGAPQLHENAPNNVVFEWTRRRQGGHRRRRRRRRGRRPPADRQPAPDPEPDGDPRRHRLVQPGHRRVHDLDVEPDAAHPAAAAGRLRDGHPGAQDPLHQPGRRRRLRVEDLLLRRHGPGAVRQQGARRPAGQVDREPARELPAHDPRPRPHHLPRDRRQARRRDHRACGSRRSPTSAAASRRSARASRRRSTAGSCRAATRSRTSTARSPASTRTRRSSTPTAAPAGPRRPTSSSGRWTSSRPRSGWTAAEIRRRNFIAAGPVPVREPVAVSGPRPAAPRSTSTRATTSRPWTRRSRWPATTTSAAAKAEAQEPRQAPRRRPLDLHRGLRRRAVEVDRRRRRGLGRRDVGVGQHQGPPDRQDRRHDGHPAAGPGPRDDLRPDRQPRAGHPDGRTSSSSTRTRRARRSATARTAVADLVGRQTAAIKAAGKIREKARRLRGPHARGVARRHRDRRRRTTSSRAARTGSRRIQEIAFALDLAFDPPEGMEPYLDETAYYDTPNCTWPFGTHIAIVEIDEETGDVDLVRYVAVDDVGKKINPMIVDGQLHGGIAQGVGQALWEGAVYDDDGQLLSGSMLDYALPRASCFPNLELDETVTPSPVNPLGVKGVGEAGAIASTAGGRQRRHRRARPARASAISTCRTRRRPCGGRCRARREARRDPGSIRLPAPGLASTRRSGSSARDPGAQGPRRRPEPPAAAEAAPRVGRTRSSTSAGCRSSRASASSTTAGSRSAR